MCQLICTNRLFSLGKIVGQTVKLFLTLPGWNSTKKDNDGLDSIYYKKATFHKLPDLMIKLNSLDDFTKSMQFLY